MIDLHDSCRSPRLVRSTLWYWQTSILRVAHSRPVTENLQVDIRCGSLGYLLSDVCEVISSDVSIPHFWPSQRLEIDSLLGHVLDPVIVGNSHCVCLGYLQSNEKGVGAAFTGCLLGRKDTIDHRSIHCRSASVTETMGYNYINSDKAANALADFVLAFLPIVFMWDVQMNLRTKVGICILMGMGVLWVFLTWTIPSQLTLVLFHSTGICDIVRAAQLKNADSPDFTCESMQPQASTSGLSNDNSLGNALGLYIWGL